MAATTVSRIERLRVAPMEPLHPEAEVCVRGVEEKMDVVAHQAIRKATPPVCESNSTLATWRAAADAWIGSLAAHDRTVAGSL